MGGQQGKERLQIIGSNSSTITRSTRAKYRSGRDVRPVGSNVFTEHNGMCPNVSFKLLLDNNFVRVLKILTKDTFFF